MSELVEQQMQNNVKLSAMTHSHTAKYQDPIVMELSGKNLSLSSKIQKRELDSLRKTICPRIYASHMVENISHHESGSIYTSIAMMADSIVSHIQPKLIACETTVNLSWAHWMRTQIECNMTKFLPVPGLEHIVTKEIHVLK